MGRSTNHVTLLGNMGADVTLHQREGRAAVATGRLATNHGTIDDDGNHGTATVWHTIVGFGATATAMAKTLHKGREVLIEGAIRAPTYERNGVETTRTEIHVSHFQLTQGAPRRADVNEAYDADALEDEATQDECEAAPTAREAA